MKYISVRASLVVIVLFVCIQSSHSQSGWQVLNSGTSLSLLDLQCVSRDTIFLFGEDGLLLKSFDGGNSFEQKQNPGALIYTAGYFLDIDTGFAGAGTGNIIKTKDGGTMWAITGGCTCFITDIVSINSLHGVFGGLSGIQITDDGGYSWSSPPLAPFFVPVKLTTLNDSVCFGIDGKVIFSSHDFGLTWQTDTLNYGSNYPLTDILFLDSVRGYVISADGYLYFTSDGAQSWNQISSNAGSNISGMVFIDSLTGFLVSNQFTIFKTTNGGITWQNDYTANEVIEKIGFDSKAVYACGQYGLVLKNELNSSIPSVASAEFSISPNPSSEMFTIRMTNKNCEIRISNLLGTEMQVFYDASDKIVFGKEFPDGVYFVKVKSGNETFVRKLVKE